MEKQRKPRLKIVVEYSSQGLNVSKELYFEITAEEAFKAIETTLEDEFSKERKARPKVSALEEHMNAQKLDDRP